MRVSSKPHRFQPLDFVTVNPSPAKGSKTTPKNVTNVPAAVMVSFPLSLCPGCRFFTSAVRNLPPALCRAAGRKKGGGTEILSVTVMLAAGYWLCRRLML